MAIINLNWMMWDAVKQAKVVGWPLPTAEQPLWPYERISNAAADYKAAGFDAALFMPSTLGAAGIYSGGYDKKEDYVLDGTAWGSAIQLIDAIDSLHAQKMRAYGDLVLHQMDGYPNQEYTSKLFPKMPSCFAWYPGMLDGNGDPILKRPGNVSPDSVPDPSGGWPDGDLCAYDQPNRYMWDGAITAAQYLANLGFDGFRIDEAKDLHAPFINDLIDRLRKVHPNLFFPAEYFDGNPIALGGYVNYWTQRRVSVLDYMFKFNVSNICNNNSRVWMGQLSDIGYCMQDSMKAVTLLENADTDTSIGEQLIWNKALGYSIMLTFPGEPMVYYRDWSSDPNCYGLAPSINNGLWIHNNLAQGDFVTRNAEYQTFAHERLGYGNAPGCVCFFNNNQYAAETVTVQTNVGPQRRMHEYTGNTGYNADKWTDWQGKLTVTIPRNVNGCNSLVYAPYI